MRNRTVAVGLGSNLGSPIVNLRTALKFIKKKFKVLKLSGIYESEALVPENAPADWNKKFLNAVVLIEASTGESPISILEQLKSIEEQMGRVSGERWAPRIIDLDILFWSSENFISERLSIPHRELFNRPFALLPLLEVWDRQELLNGRDIHWASEWVDHVNLSTKRSKIHIWPEMMGVVNLTTDSFSDAGKFTENDKLAEHLLKLKESGTEIFDFGAESTRPGALGVSEELELQRLKNALKIYNELQIKAKISIDCRHPQVLQKLSEFYSFDIVNDVEGLHSSDMITFVKSKNLRAVVMHSLSVPPRRDLTLSDTENPTDQMSSWWAKQIERLQLSGIDSSRIILDPGIGFGKTAKQNLFILKYADRIETMGSEILIGHSRKSFQELYSSRSSELRDVETAVVTAALSKLPISYLRVHDVSAQKAAWLGGGYFGN